jgi:hypothetical protein
MYLNFNFVNFCNISRYEISRNKKNYFAKYEINISQNFVDHPNLEAEKIVAKIEIKESVFFNTTSDAFLYFLSFFSLNKKQTNLM